MSRRDLHWPGTLGRAPRHGPAWSRPRPLLVNVRGASGSGKTELVRRVMRLYAEQGHRPFPIYRPGRERPACYEIQRLGGPLAVLGHYERTSGGCDTLGPATAAFRLAEEHAARGSDVLFEGLDVSRDRELSARLAQAHELRVLHLQTPLDCCIRNVIRRRRARRSTRPRIAAALASDHRAIAEASRALERCAVVESLPFDQALARIGQLLGIGAIAPAAPLGTDENSAPRGTQNLSLGEALCRS